jgi:hypothetical protein
MPRAAALGHAAAAALEAAGTAGAAVNDDSNTSGSQTMARPRLVAAIERAAGRIPTNPRVLQLRVREQLELQHRWPGLDLCRSWRQQ